MVPKNFIFTIGIITLILLVLNKAKFQTYIYYIFLCLLAFISSILPLFLLNSGAVGRVNVPAMIILGMSALLVIGTSLSNNLENKDLKSYKKFQAFIAPTFTIVLLFLNSMYIIQNTSEHIAGNKVDDNNGASIKAIVDKYEKENNITVTKFSYIYDEQPNQFAIGLKPIQSFTERKFACTWSILFAMDYYCNKNFQLVNFEWPEEKKNTMYTLNTVIDTNSNNYDCFLEEQIYFKNDTLYMIIY